MLKYYFKNLKNNLSLFVVKTKKLSSLDVTLYVKTGSAYEGLNNNGISHLLEHLLFLKTKDFKKDPSALNIYPFSQKDFTLYEMTTHKDLLNPSLSSLFSVIDQPKFSQKNLKLVKDIVKEELLELQQYPEDLFNQYIDSFLYKNTNLSLNIGGSTESLEKIKLDQLKKWYRSYYQEKNMILTLVGDVNIDQTMRKINSLLKNNSKYFSNEENNLADFKINYPKNTKKLIKLKNNINLNKSHLAFVFPTAGINHKNYLDFVLLAEILKNEIRQEFENSGLLYDISFYYHNYLKTGEYRVITSCQKKNVNLIIKKFNNFLANYKMSSSYFDKIKKYLKYQFLLKEDNVDELSSLSLYLLNNQRNLITLEDEVKHLEAIGFSEINKLKKKYFNKDNSYYFLME